MIASRHTIRALTHTLDPFIGDLLILRTDPVLARDRARLPQSLRPGSHAQYKQARAFLRRTMRAIGEHASAFARAGNTLTITALRMRIYGVPVMPKFLDDMYAAKLDAIGSYGRVNPFTRNDPAESPLVRIGKDLIDSKPRSTPRDGAPAHVSRPHRVWSVLGFRERIDTCRRHGMQCCYRCTP